MPISPGSYDSRVGIHKHYRGLRISDLNQRAQTTDAEFVHPSGFIGGAWSLKSAVKIAEDSLKYHYEQEEIQKDMDINEYKR